MELIKNCPHCGAVCGLVLKQNLSGIMYTYVRCDGCGAQSRNFRITESLEKAQEKAIAAWNRREPQSEDT